MTDIHRHGSARPGNGDIAGTMASLNALCAVARTLGERGWTPAGSGNFSLRLADGNIAMSISERDKLNLGAADFMLLDAQGVALDASLTPSAEYLLHTHIYQRFANVNCVLHTHSVTQTLASMRYFQTRGVELHGYELLKALPGYDSHEQCLHIPVVANNQHTPTLVAAVDPLLDECSRGYLIAGHGMYCWGKDVSTAYKHLEALDFMLCCELQRWQP